MAEFFEVMKQARRMCWSISYVTGAREIVLTMIIPSASKRSDGAACAKKMGAF